MTIELYHGSHSRVSQILDSTPSVYIDFHGVFASCIKEEALSHGKILHKILLNESEILTQYDLSYDIEYKKVTQIIAEYLELTDENLIEQIYDHVLYFGDIQQEYSQEIIKAMRAEQDSVDWEMQALRGIIAKKLGYKAVEMRDEHGETYLVNSSAEIIEV